MLLRRHHTLADALRLPMLLLPAGTAFRHDPVQGRHRRQHAAPQVLVRDLLVTVSASLLLLLLRGVCVTAVDAVDVVLQGDLENAIRVVPMLLLRVLLVFYGGGRSGRPRRNHGISLQTVTGTIVARLEARTWGAK